MIWLCVECGDFSPLLPLSWYDFIHLREALALNKNSSRDKFALFDDCRFFLGGINSTLTGNTEWVNLPSEILRRSRFYEQREQL